MSHPTNKPIRQPRRWSRVGLVVCLSLLSVVIAHGEPATTAPAASAATNKPAPTGFVITIRKPLTAKTVAEIRPLLTEAKTKATPGSAVIFDLDTGGGTSMAGMALADAIKDTLGRMRTVAFVNREATGAGAIVAMACDEIVMAPRGRLGDAQPRVANDDNHQRHTVRARLRAEFRAAATAKGYPSALAEAMVAANVTVWKVKRIDSDEIRYVMAKEFEGQIRDKDHPDAKWEAINRAVVAANDILIVTAAEAQEYGFTKGDPPTNLAALTKRLGVATPLVTLGKPTIAKPPKTAITTRPGETKQTRLIPGKTFKNVYVIPITEDIMSPMDEVIARKILTVKGNGADMVIFKIDTNGGSVAVAQTISKLIRNELSNIPTVAYLDTHALSAGAWLTLSCDYTVMRPNSIIGDAAPISMGGTLEGVKREKLETYLRKLFADAADKQGFPALLAESMVDITIEVWLEQNVRTGEKRFARRDPIGDDSDTDRDRARSAFDSAGEWEQIKVVVKKGNLLTLNTTDAKEYGFVHDVVDDMAGLEKLCGIQGKPVVLGDSWSEDVVGFMVSPMVTGILSFLVLFFAYVEINTPGFGVGGVMVLICLGLLLGSRYLTGLAQEWEIAILVIGMLLILAEIFVIPGFGVAGISGAILCLIGMVAVLIPNAPDTWPLPESGLIMDTFINGAAAIGVGFICSCLAAAVAARYLPKLPLAGRLVLATAPSSEGSTPATDDAPVRHIKVGDTGVIESHCRPAGRARFADELVHVMTEGELLRPGAPVIVVRNEGNRLVVRAIDA